MKKITNHLVKAAMMLAMMLTLTACGDDKDNDFTKTTQLSGLYYYDNNNPAGLDDRTAFNFVSSNTVEVYYGLTRNADDTWYGQPGKAFPLRSGWYYWTGNYHSYSYYIAGDVVYIGNNIKLTIKGNNLYDSNMGLLYKWN